MHFLIDEAATLGHLEQLDDAVDKYRGYGVRLILIYQSLGQLRKCFPEGQDQTLLSNVTQVFFGVNDLPTAEYVSNRLGDETIVVESGGSSWGGSRQFSYNSQGDNNGRSWNTTSNWQQQGRRLLKSDEVMALSPRTAITFAPGLPPICTRLTRYYEGRPDSWWRRLLQATRANIYAAAALAAVMFGTEVLRDMDNQPKLQQPRVVPGVPGPVAAAERREKCDLKRKCSNCLAGPLVKSGRNSSAWACRARRNLAPPCSMAVPMFPTGRARTATVQRMARRAWTRNAAAGHSA